MSTTAAAAPPSPAHATATPLRQRRPRWAIWLGVLLIALGAIVGSWLFTQGQSTRSVIVVRVDLTAGQPIKATDLAVTTVPTTSELSTVGADQLDEVTGRYATMNLPAGALLNPGASTSSLTPAPGQSIVGIGVKAGQLPAKGLSAGEKVRIVVTNSPGAGGVPQQGGGGGDDTTTPGTTWSGVVVDTGSTDPSGLTTIDVTIASTDAAAVAAAAGTGYVAIIVDGQG